MESIVNLYGNEIVSTTVIMSVLIVALIMAVYEFIVYKVGKMDGDFAENLKEYLANNPKYTKKDAGDVRHRAMSGLRAQLELSSCLRNPGTVRRTDGEICPGRAGANHGRVGG